MPSKADVIWLKVQDLLREEGLMGTFIFAYLPEEEIYINRENGTLEKYIDNKIQQAKISTRFRLFCDEKND